MAITRHLAELILAEHRFRPITGQVLLLGRQMVFLTADEARQLIAKMGIPLRGGTRIEYGQTPYARERGYISDASFFGLFSDAQVTASDVSDYEGADIVFDLSGALPASMREGYDFIYNGSVLDNVFDPAACIRNVTRMLKPGGVVFHYEGYAHSDPAYLKFSPEWFFDFYALNGFEDFQAFLCFFEHVHRSSWQLVEWAPFVAGQSGWEPVGPIATSLQGVVVAIAQKAPAATIDAVPIQAAYRKNHGPYLAAFERYRIAERRRALTAGRGSAADVATVPYAPPLRGRSKLTAIAKASGIKAWLPQSVKGALLRHVDRQRAASGPLDNESVLSLPQGCRFLGLIG